MKRKLNANELLVLKSIYFNDIDIVFTKKSYRDDFSKKKSDMALLVHEMCHVWQYQNLNYKWYKAGIEHLKFRKSTYSYTIAEHKKLTDFRFEQQGEIMADYFRKRLSSDVSVYEDVIYSVIKSKIKKEAKYENKKSL